MKERATGGEEGGRRREVGGGGGQAEEVKRVSSSRGASRGNALKKRTRGQKRIRRWPLKNGAISFSLGLYIATVLSCRAWKHKRKDSRGRERAIRGENANQKWRPSTLPPLFPWHRFSSNVPSATREPGDCLLLVAFDSAVA